MSPFCIEFYFIRKLNDSQWRDIKSGVYKVLQEQNNGDSNSEEMEYILDEVDI